MPPEYLDALANPNTLQTWLESNIEKLKTFRDFQGRNFLYYAAMLLPGNLMKVCIEAFPENEVFVPIMENTDSPYLNALRVCVLSSCYSRVIDEQR